MLSEDNIERINDQIADELNTVSHPFKTHQEKTDAIERVAQLKSLLEPIQPTMPCDPREVAQALLDMKPVGNVRDQSAVDTILNRFFDRQ